jgi:hypothetical protein
VTSGCRPVEVFPFDTGALKGLALAEDIHDDLSPFDFALEPKVDSAQRLVRIFFGDEKSYYSGVHRRPNLPNYSLTHVRTEAHLKFSK